MTTSQTHPDRLADGGRPPIRIVHVEADRLFDAVMRLVCPVAGRLDHQHAQRFIEFAAGHGVSLDHLWAAVDEGELILATALAVPSPGRTAMVFASHPHSARAMPACCRLIEHVAGELAALPVDLAQALLEPGERTAIQAFSGGGFTELASLSYLERPMRGGPEAGAVDWPADVTIEPYRSELAPAFCDALDASYVDTLDCPGLLGLRKTRDILEGHRASGKFEPGLWTLLRIDGRAAGVLLLNPSPASQSIELVYLGLGREARGRGLGRMLLAHGLRLLARRSERVITLAVDEKNQPALKLYQSCGFSRVLRRVAMIRPIRRA